jgi:epoxyqueuosine reductase
VCPWNRKAPEAAEPAFLPRAGFAAPELIPLLRLSDDEFHARFRGSPVIRAKRRGFIRNVAVALGNLRDPRALPALEAVLHEAEPLLRGHAAWALGRLGGGEARRVLRSALRHELDGGVKEEMTLALAESAWEDEV